MVEAVVSKLVLVKEEVDLASWMVKRPCGVADGMVPWAVHRGASCCTC